MGGYAYYKQGDTGKLISILDQTRLHGRTEENGKSHHASISSRVGGAPTEALEKQAQGDFQPGVRSGEGRVQPAKKKKAEASLVLLSRLTIATTYLLGT